MPVLALGVSYRGAPVELLERLAFAEADLPKAYRRLGELDSVSEAVVLSTCNRVEVYAEVGAYHEGFQDLKRFLAEARDVPVEEFAEPLYSHYEDHAAEHVFAVASGIDSMVLGEPQILSQVREAFKGAEAEGAAGPALSALFHQALRVGKRARIETRIGASPTAFVEAGAGLAEQHLRGLAGRSLLVVGAGKMGTLTIRSLRDRGVDRVRVLSRSPERARRLAARVGGAHGGLDDLVGALADADLVVSSTGSAGVAIYGRAVEEAMRRRDGPMFLLDLAVPRDVEPLAREVPGVAVADIDDLGRVLAPGTGSGLREVDAVRTIVGEEVARYAARRREARLAPLIAALHERGEDVRARELRRAAGRLRGLSDDEREAVEAVTRGIVRKLLHHPVVRLKELSGPGGGESHARALAELFDLPRDEA